MKILVCVPGSWKHGLDSPERGESRWAQNLARLLGSTGKYKVYAASLGDHTAGVGRSAPGVTLLHHDQVRDHGPYDLYFGADNRDPIAQANSYFHIHWGLDGYLKDPNFPKNNYIIYPHFDLESTFINSANPNRDRTFFLPATFGDRMLPPAFDKMGMLWPTKDPTLLPPIEHFQVLVGAVREVRLQFPELKMYWWFASILEQNGYISRQDFPNDEYIELSPYWKMLEVIDKCKINIIGGAPACIPDCAVKGVPSLIWDYPHVLPFVKNVAKSHGLLIPLNAGKDVVRGVILTMLTNVEKYNNFVLDLQHTFRHHTDSGVLGCFEQILNKL
jgi:hypothetical protein